MATGVSSGGECGWEGWATGVVASLSWWSSGESVSASLNSGISISLMRGKGTVGHAIASSLPYKNSCISYCLLMFLERSDMLAGLVGEFFADLT